MNHAIGFHERSERSDDDCQLRPDGFYGLSKAYGESMGRLYWDKHEASRACRSEVLLVPGAD